MNQWGDTMILDDEMTGKYHISNRFSNIDFSATIRKLKLVLDSHWNKEDSSFFAKFLECGCCEGFFLTVASLDTS